MMASMAETAIWGIWAFLCAWGVRLAVVAMLWRRMGGWAFLAAYLTWFVMLVIGFAATGATGYAIYAPDPNALGQRVGEAILFFSPLGLPLVVGAPMVLALDAALAIWRRVSRPA